MTNAFTVEEIDDYAQSLRHRAARAWTDRNAQRQQLLERIERISEPANQFPTIQRVWVFGSLLQPERFHPSSDVDIAVEPPHTPELFRFAAALERWLGWPCDVVPLQPGTSLGKLVQQTGQCIYDRSLSFAGEANRLLLRAESSLPLESKEDWKMKDTQSLRLLIAEVTREWAIAGERAEVVASTLPTLEASPREADIGWIALQLHYWYTACEQMFERIAVAFGTLVEQSNRYHIDLLHQMSLDIPGIRPPVLQSATVRSLDEYRAFRHLVRNLYAGTLDPEHVRRLAENLPQVSGMVLHDWEGFGEILWRMIETIEKADSGENG
jgi:predicted nucleotidyltransferase